MQNQSLDGIEEELARTERKLATFRETLRRSHQESAADDAALREMGARVKEIMSRPKTWKGGSKRADAAELERLRADMRARSEATTRTVEAMKALSAEATALSKRHQDLSKMRADLVARGADQEPASRPAGPSVMRPAPPQPAAFGSPRSTPPPAPAPAPAASPAPSPRRQRPQS